MSVISASQPTVPTPTPQRHHSGPKGGHSVKIDTSKIKCNDNFQILETKYDSYKTSNLEVGLAYRDR